MSLILEIDGDQDGADYLAKDAVQAIACHYCQEIHLADTNANAMPYFDPLHGSPQTLTNFTRHWADQIQETINRRDNLEFLDVGCGLIGGYAECIRIKCFRRSKKKKMSLEPTCHVVLIQFEQLLANYVSTNKDTISLQSDVSCQKATALLNRIHSSIEAIVSDVFSLTATKQISMKGKDSHAGINNIISNGIIPILLRILEHCVFIQQCILEHRHEHDHAAGHEKKDITSSELEMHKFLLTINTFAALSCSGKKVHEKSNTIHLTPSNLGPSEILPKQWFREISLKHIFLDKNGSSYPPIILASDCRERKNPYFANLLSYIGLNEENLSFMDEAAIHFSKDTSGSSSLPMPWMDHKKGIGMRAASSLLNKLGSLALSLEYYVTGKDTKNITDKSSVNATSLDLVVRVVGEDYMVLKARENFFGRLHLFLNSEAKLLPGEKKEYDFLNPSNGETNPRSTAFNGIIQPRPKVNALEAIETFTRLPSKGYMKHYEEEAYAEIPSRIPSTVRLLANLKFPSIASEVWDNALPIIFALIDSITESHQALGASLLLHFLNESTPTSIMSNGRAHNIQQVLTLACRTCNSAVPLILLCKARCKLFENLPRNELSQKVIQDAITSSLNWVQKNAYCGPGGKPEEIDKIVGLLVGSINPLLEQLVPLPDAMSLEVGRSGLATLLPLIRWDSKTNNGRRVQMASISCLIPLLLGAYPMMERHGGKVMSELMACALRAQRDIQIFDKISTNAKNLRTDEEITGTKILLLVTLHAASIALVICSTRADEVLMKVEKGNYAAAAKKLCEIVRSGASFMRNNELKNKAIS